MKKLFFALLSMVLVFSVQAQNSKDALKTAEKALKPFFKDMATNADMAKQTLMDLEANFGTPDKPDYFVKKGDLYLKILEEEEKKAILNPQYEMIIASGPEMAMNSYMEAMGTKKEKDALKGLGKIQGSMALIGNKQFDKKEYTGAFYTFTNVIKIHEVLTTAGEPSTLVDTAAVGQQKFYTLVSGSYSEDITPEQTLPIIKDLYETKYDHAFVYEGYFKVLKDTDKEMAMKVLEEGRAAYPDDSGLLYAEINFYLVEGELEKPIDRIKTAIAKEPENISLYTTLGNVYDQLNQKKREAGEIEEADKYFANALDYFEQAKAKDSENFDAVYSIGALYYNRAASMTEKINELGNDYSADGTKAYEAAKKEMNGLFLKGQPFFEKALVLNSNSKNAVIALKEIYARLGDFDKSNEMKAKLEGM